MNLRNISFNRLDVIRSRELQKQVRQELKLAQIKYKNKVQTLLCSGNSWPAWEGVKSITGMQSRRTPLYFAGKSDSELADDLHSVYNHFKV